MDSSIFPATSLEIPAPTAFSEPQTTEGNRIETTDESGYPAMHRLIVGTAAAGRLNSGAAIVRLLEACLQGGATAFDTAPLYASGAMETFLGQVLKTRPTDADVTVNTKFGLSPIVPFTHPGRNYFLSKLAQVAARRMGIKGKKAVWTAAMASLERSIRHLGEGRIDVFFAHEVPVEILMTPRFLEFIKHAKERGLFRRFGLGGYRSLYPGPASRELLDKVDVIQVESVPGLRPALPQEWSGEIFLHGILGPMRKTAENAGNSTNLEEYFKEALDVQGANRLVVGISRTTNFQMAVKAIKDSDSFPNL
jgi:Aldo/keto reductase family